MALLSRRCSVGRGTGTGGAHPRSSSSFKCFRSFSFARRIAALMNGARSFENPLGSPRLRRVIRVPPALEDSQVYVVSIGNGPSLVRMTSRSSPTSSTISYVYASLRPRKCTTKATREPTASGGAVFHSTDSMLTYQLGAFPGSPAYAATTERG